MASIASSESAGYSFCMTALIIFIVLCVIGGFLCFKAYDLYGDFQGWMVKREIERDRKRRK